MITYISEKEATKYILASINTPPRPISHSKLMEYVNATKSKKAKKGGK